MPLTIDLVNSETGEMVRFYWFSGGGFVSVSHFTKISGKVTTSDTLEVDQARLRWKELIHNGFHKLNSQPSHTC